MKALLLTTWVLLLAAGCAATGPAQSGRGAGASLHDGAAAPQPVPDPFPPPAGTPIGPRLVVPVTGGPPVPGISLGGDLYLPVTGGPPVVGIPID